MCSTELPIMPVHLMMLPLRQAPSSFYESILSSKVDFQARLVMGMFISSSLIVYIWSPIMLLIICKEPSKKLTAASPASVLKRMWKTSVSAY